MKDNVLKMMTYGVYVVSTWDKGRPTGCAANSVMQISDSPATIAISINRKHFTHKCIEECKKFAVSVLSEKTSMQTIGTFGFQSGATVDKFEQVDYLVKNHMPVLAQCCGYLTCELIEKLETSTHTIFLGKVTEGEVLENAEAMTYQYYQKEVKGKE